MNKLITNKHLTLINFTIVAYFSLLWLLNFYRLDYALIGVFQEILTIPFLIAQLVFLVIGIQYLIKNKITIPFAISFLSLVLCVIISIKSFF